MKPAQISALVLAGALGGAVLMKVVQRPHPASENFGTKPIASAPVSTPPPAVQTPAAPAPSEPPQPPVQAQDTAVPATPSNTPPARAKAESPTKVAAKDPLPIVTKPISKASSSPARRHAPPPANPRPLVVAKLDHPPQQMPAPQTAPPAPVETAPAPPAAAPVSAPPVQENPTPPDVPPVENVTPPAPPPPVPHTVTLNAGLLIPVRLVDGLSTERNAPGDTFLATIDREVVVDGFVIAERGARVEGRVVASDSGSKIKGNAALSVELTRLHTSDRQVVPIETEAFEKHIQAERGEDIAKVGAGAALGAIIGAIAGGGKGAAIGAGVGGGAGAGGVMLTRKPATLPSETRITFRLRTPVKLTEKLN